MKLISLGNISPEEFLREYWQKKPLLVRSAFTEFQDLLSADELISLACQENTQSRLITRADDTWQVQSDPLTRADFTHLGAQHWTLLVHDINHFLTQARDLLRKFSFIPYARLDDLMVSFSPKGGGIGPHFDSYDVFLLQGSGAKRWQISAQYSSQLIADLPLKILRDFNPQQEWVLEAGDMLYLPPNYAHNGVAENDCVTYSVGFRAPSHQEICEQFLVYMQDHIKVSGRYSDPDLALQANPANISAAMLHKTQSILDAINWEEGDVESFLGVYLTEPKPHIYFTRPHSPLSQQKFIRQARMVGVQLDLKSLMLFRRNKIFINGDVHIIGNDPGHSLETFASNQRCFLSEGESQEISNLFYQWYLYGYILLINEGNIESKS